MRTLVFLKRAKKKFPFSKFPDTGERGLSLLRLNFWNFLLFLSLKTTTNSSGQMRQLETVNT